MSHVQGLSVQVVTYVYSAVPNCLGTREMVQSLGFVTGRGGAGFALGGPGGVFCSLSQPRPCAGSTHSCPGWGPVSCPTKIEGAYPEQVLAGALARARNLGGP